MTTFLQLIVAGLGTGAGYALIGIGITLIYRTTGVLNFAQGAFSVIAGFLMATVLSPLPGALAALIAISVVAAIGAAFAPLAMGPRRRGTTIVASMIVTIGLALLVQAALLLTWGETPRTFPAISGSSWTLGGVLVQPQYALILVVTLLTSLAVGLLLRRTMLGNALVACADSRRAAQVVGLNVRRLGALTFALSAAIGALAGVLLTPIIAVTPSSDVALAINGFAAAAFGGLISLPGALLGGLLLGIGQALVAGYVDPQYQLAVALVAMLAIMVVRAQRTPEV